PDLSGCIVEMQQRLARWTGQINWADRSFISLLSCGFPEGNLDWRPPLTELLSICSGVSCQSSLHLDSVGSTIRCRFPDFVWVACRFPRFMSVGTVLVGHWESAPDQRG